MHHSHISTMVDYAALIHPTVFVYNPVCSLYVPQMPNYRRLFVPGGLYTFTVCLKDRTSRLLVDEIDAFHAAYAKTQIKYPFETLAWCILPDHVHMIWKLPDDDHDFSVRWRLIKTHFTKSLPNVVDGQRLGERGLWQRRFWEHLVRDERDLEAQMNYVHFNPVKHGLVDHPDAWPHSSWFRYQYGIAA